MKTIIIVCVIFTFISGIKSYVVATTKDVEITTVSQNKAISNSSEIKVPSSQNFTKVLMRDENYIYLDDVIFALKHRNWTEEEKSCLQQTLRLLYNLQNSTLWAVWDWDSTSSEPQGILFGNRYHLGNFDECLSAPWYKTNPDLRTQYCLTEIVLERHDKKPVRKQQDQFNPYGSALNYIESRSKFQRPLNRVTWGACVPESCSAASVKTLMQIMLARSYVGAAGLHANISVTDECQKAGQPKEYSALCYAFLGTIGGLFIIVLICTYLNSKVKKKSHDTSLGRKIVQACCIKENFKDLYKVQKGGVDVLYGIRFLSMCVVVLGHQYGMFNGGPITNGFNVDKDAMTILGMMFLHDDIVVDSFFFLSGFLAARGIVRLKQLPNLLILFLRRYVRLVVAYAVIIFFVVSLYPYTGSGPLWNRAVAADVGPCLENWWLNLLMISNYVNSDNMCLVISWYIPCDFHFFVITILLYWLYKRFPGFGSFCVVIVTIASIVLPGVINYVYKLPAIQLFTYEFLLNPRSQEQFHISYIKSHNRYPSYLIGFFCGYYFATRGTSGSLGRIPSKWSILGACVSIVGMMLMMLSGPALVWAGYGLLVDAIYASLNRPLWTVSLAILVICCSYGKVPMVTSFLSWYPWVPLSRLAYGLYVTHALIITRNVNTIRNPQHTDHLALMNSTAGVIFWGCIASLALWLIAEAPINNILMVFLRPSRKEEKTEATANGATISNGCRSTAADNKGYVPENIYYSSKI